MVNLFQWVSSLLTRAWKIGGWLGIASMPREVILAQRYVSISVQNQIRRSAVEIPGVLFFASMIRVAKCFCPILLSTVVEIQIHLTKIAL